PSYISHATYPPKTYTLSLHDALPISHFEQVGEIRIHGEGEPDRNGEEAVVVHAQALEAAAVPQEPRPRQMQRSARDLSLSLIGQDRKSTRLNSSHEWISYAVFCLKKK